MNKITMTLQVDHLILEALKEDISSEDVTKRFWMLTQKWSCSARTAMK